MGERLVGLRCRAGTGRALPRSVGSRGRQGPRSRSAPDARREGLGVGPGRLDSRVTRETIGGGALPGIGNPPDVPTLCDCDPFDVLPKQGSERKGETMVIRPGGSAALTSKSVY